MAAETPFTFPASPRLLNIGCGDTWHAAWLNCDVEPLSPEVRRLDARAGIPLADGVCDAVYHSHVLEHLEPAAGRRLVEECRRVLKVGGVLRVAVPDLERIVRAYLDGLDVAAGGGDRFAYDWAVVELLDQLVRPVSGGEMERLMRAADGEQAAHIAERVGVPGAAEAPRSPAKPGGAARLGRALRSRARRARRGTASLATRALGGREAAQALELGRFRRSGEVHLWMYDRFSLGALLSDVGFRDVHVCTAAESAIPSFADYGLDCVDGRVRKPDSLFMEGRR